MTDHRLQICPEDVLQVLMPAHNIPDGSTVSKRTGEVTFILRHDIKVYSDMKGEAPLSINGCFLVSGRGQINQVRPTTILNWHVEAETLVDELQLAWELTPQ